MLYTQRTLWLKSVLIKGVLFQGTKKYNYIETLAVLYRLKGNVQRLNIECIVHVCHVTGNIYSLKW